MSLSPSLDYDSFSDFPYFCDLDSFEDYWTDSWQNILPFGFVWYFSQSQFGVKVRGRKPTEVSRLSHHIIIRVHSFNITYHCCSPGVVQAVFARFLHCSVSLLSLHFLYSLERNHCVQPTYKWWGFSFHLPKGKCHLIFCLWTYQSRILPLPNHVKPCPTDVRVFISIDQLFTIVSQCILTCLCILFYFPPFLD